MTRDEAIELLSDVWDTGFTPSCLLADCDECNAGIAVIQQAFAETFDILEALGRLHPELRGYYARGTGGVEKRQGLLKPWQRWRLLLSRPRRKLTLWVRSTGAIICNPTRSTPTAGGLAGNTSQTGEKHTKERRSDLL